MVKVSDKKVYEDGPSEPQFKGLSDDLDSWGSEEWDELAQFMGEINKHSSGLEDSSLDKPREDDTPKASWETGQDTENYDDKDFDNTAFEISEDYLDWMISAEEMVTEEEYQEVLKELELGEGNYEDSQMPENPPGEEDQKNSAISDLSKEENSSYQNEALDQQSIDPKDSSFQHHELSITTTEEPWALPAGNGDFIVRSGDSISSIAASCGHFWKIIWNDPGNRDLAMSRENPDVLFPGDRLHIPSIKQAEKSVETEKRHRFRRKGVPDKLHLRFMMEDEPLSGEAYVVTLDVGATHSGNLDEEGRLKVPISGKAKEATIWIGTTNKMEYKFKIGSLDPIDSISGVQQRLENLGYFKKSVNGILTDHTRAAIAAFQMDNAALTVSGKIDKLTRDKLHEIHDKKFE